MAKHQAGGGKAGILGNVSEFGFVGYWTWDLKSGAVETSDGAETTPERKRAYAILPEDLAWLQLEHQQCFGPSGHGILEFRVTDRSGTIRWLMYRAVFEIDASGQAIRARGLVLDVTAIKAEGNAVRTAPAPFANPIQSFVDAILAAHGAARQLDDAGLVRQVEGLLFVAGRRLARDLAGGGTPVH